MQTNILHNTDCLVGLSDIPSQSIDVVVTDCPYKICAGGVTIEEHTHEVSGILQKRNAPHGNAYETGNRHISLGGVLNDKQIVRSNSRLDNKCITQDNVVPSAVKNGKMFAHNDIQFHEWLPEIYRVLKKGTHCYIMVNARNLKNLQTEAEKVGFVFQNLLVWSKVNSTPNKYYMQCAEFILMLSKRPARNINDMGTKTILTVPNIMGKGSKGEHPTAKPVALMEILIRNSTKEGDIVLDPFAGGGSTLVAAKRLSRQYIGFEIDPTYYRLAQNKLTNEPQQTTLF